MSLLEKIIHQKSNLMHTETLIRTVDGDVMKENRAADGSTSVVLLPIRSVGFVVDTKPDLQVAKVTDGIYMGSQDVAYDSKLLNRYGIKTVLSVGSEISNVNCDDIEYVYVEALDVPEFDMSKVFDKCYKVIYSVVNIKRESIYVHCNAGVSRSASVVIAYLMRSNRISYDEAYNLVKKCRSIIRPNEGFVKQLKLYECFLINNDS